jgi:hypothetical protein
MNQRLNSPVMQSLAILLIGISCRQHFESSYGSSVDTVRKLVVWLQHMRQTNETAERAYHVIYNIVKPPNLSAPAIWKDIVDMFPDEIVPQEPPPPRMDAYAYPWPSGEQSDQYMVGGGGG